MDDASTKPELKIQLEDYIANIPKVSLLRLPERGGLITARLEGAKNAKGEVIIFLDSHTEANVNWLPPLLDPISVDYRTAVCPFIDVVDYDNFQVNEKQISFPELYTLSSTGLKTREREEPSTGSSTTNDCRCCRRI